MRSSLHRFLELHSYFVSKLEIVRRSQHWRQTCTFGAPGGGVPGEGRKEPKTEGDAQSNPAESSNIHSCQYLMKQSRTVI
jgi:hypothetical protein